MLKGIQPARLMDTIEEVHSFLIGLFEIICPWRAGYQDRAHPPEDLKGEHHYYMGGRAVGFVVLVFILLGIAKFIMEVLL